MPKAKPSKSPAAFSGEKIDWHEPRRLDCWQPDLDSFRETLDGGQSFAWWPESDTAYTGILDQSLIRLTWDQDRIFWQSTGENSDPLLPLRLEDYLGSNAKFQTFYDQLPWRSDPHLIRCMQAFPQLRILKQSPSETLLGFLCSATKQIPQIKQVLHEQSQLCGERIEGTYHALPTWAALALQSEEALRACKLGFRARNIRNTALLLATRSPNWLEQLRDLDTASLRTQLESMPGVGRKIADCVLLFGYHRLEAFPIDTWIAKALRRRYQLEFWTNEQIAHFAQLHFGSAAGLAQQFLFSWERRHG